MLLACSFRKVRKTTAALSWYLEAALRRPFTAVCGQHTRPRDARPLVRRPLQLRAARHRRPTALRRLARGARPMSAVSCASRGARPRRRAARARQRRGSRARRVVARVEPRAPNGSSMRSLVNGTHGPVRRACRAKATEARARGCQRGGRRRGRCRGALRLQRHRLPEPAAPSPQHAPAAFPPGAPAVRRRPAPAGAARRGGHRLPALGRARRAHCALRARAVLRGNSPLASQPWNVLLHAPPAGRPAARGGMRPRGGTRPRPADGRPARAQWMAGT